ncbi:threonine--tRNA ligase [candidate division Kazan bacterium RBG_13_50_9]|uniref:Threonine--tRNA ligase n=1 Tax=candidate division Kazan bacterium RBG_13_50_9 TaxID=1798535 RepID=A0A1F4NSY8_UNCK3|nr:MAG: threonine--tRNA ligase [candidate division Kazan bacterium RBG_13_50_9]
MAKRQRAQRTNKHSEISTIRHSASHLLAEAVLNLYPETKLAIGPATEEGFYYDFEFKRSLTDADLPKIEAEMIRLAAEGRKFKHSQKTIAAALKWAQSCKQPYKIELIKDLKKAGHKRLSFYASGRFTDLCEGPHVKNTSAIGAFKLLSLAGAYWRGDEDNPQLTRIYGTAFATKKELAEHLKRIEEARRRDHRVLGERLDLFSFHEEGPGFPFWHPRGWFIFSEILTYMRRVLAESGYQEINTPIILNERLWHKSGHWDNYQESMYFTEIDKRKYAIKPMNCPGGLLIFTHRLRSYRDLPMRMGEFGLVHRHELSGVLHGLFRARSFTQDDAHVYCTPDQVKGEIKTLIRLTLKVYRDFGLTDYRIELSTRPAKSIGSDAIWRKSEKIMKDIIKEERLKVEINKGEGAFYGPKFDFHVRDILGRSWQLGTIQLDFSMPERLGATYIDKGGKKKTPIMIHRALFGSLERFIGILLEHYGGALPLWLAPIQAAILPISDKETAYAKKVLAALATAGLRTFLDDRNESLSRKIRDAELQKIPYMLIIGPKETRAKTVSVRDSSGDTGSKSLVQTIKHLSGFRRP